MDVTQVAQANPAQRGQGTLTDSVTARLRSSVDSHEAGRLKVLRQLEYRRHYRVMTGS